LALINQPYLKSLPVTRASEVIVTSKAMGNGQWAKEITIKKVFGILKMAWHKDDFF
jgi:hypothetical protein